MEKVKRLHELGIDIEHGIIPVIGEINEDLYANLVNSINSIANAGLEYDQLTILLSTYGGDLYHSFAIYDLLRAQPMKIRIVCNGPVMSGGTIILMAGDSREMTPLSFLMVHYGFDMNDSHQSLKHNELLMKTMKNIYKENCNATAKAISGWFNVDTYFTAERALQLGLVDKVTEYAKKGKRKQKRATRSRK